MMNDVIRLENVVKMYSGNRRALGGISMHIPAKERVAICGPPGSGKRTLMRIIAGMEASSAGEVYVLDQAVHDMQSAQTAVMRNRHIGIVAQRSFMNRLSVLQNVSLPLTASGMARHQRSEKAKELLNCLGIGHIAYAYPSQITAYQALIATLARAMIVQPQIMMLYEAAACLSQKEKEQFDGTINAISEYGDFTVLSFDSEPNDEMLTDRRIMLRYGRITEDISACKEY